MEWNHIVPGLKEAMILAVNNNDWSAVRGFLEGMTPKNTAVHTQLRQIDVNDNIIKESCSRGFTELVSLFLNNGFPVDYIIDEYNETMLHLAAREGYISLVKLLLKSGANINIMSIYGKTPLHKAVCKNQLNVAKHLISVGADINIRSIFGMTLLHAALCSNNVTVEMFQLLLDSGCNPNVQCNSYPPLCLAVERNDVNIVQMLLDAGAHVNGTHSGIPLHKAILYVYIPIMELLLKNGADVNVKDRYGNTALHEAVLWKNLQSVKFLIEHGSQINTVNNNHETPLSTSIIRRKYDIAILLMNSGADLDLYIYHTLLHEAIRGSAPVEIIECLLEHGARVTTLHVQQTALQFIFFSVYTSEKKLHIAKLLLIYGSDHYVEDRYGNTVLHWACEMGDVELVEYLIYYGLNVDAKNREGKKPYDIATDKGYTNIVRAITKYHCNRYTSF